MNGKAEKAKAKEKRRLEELIKDLEVCACLYPLDVLRSISGHQINCPAHKRFMDRKGD